MLNSNIIKELADFPFRGEWRRTWLLGQWRYQSSHSIKLADTYLGSILSALSKNLIPLPLWQGKELSDVAGALPSEGDTTPVCLQVHGEMRINDNEWEEFKYSLKTPFIEFKGAHHIVHHGEDLRAGSLPNFVSGMYLGKLIPLKITSFSIGLQYYESRHTIFLGYNPTPTAEILISANKDSLTLEFSLEQQKTKNPDLVRDHPAVQLLKHLDRSSH